MTNSPARKRNWYIATAIGLAAALAFLANIDGSLSLAERIFSGNSDETTPVITNGTTPPVITNSPGEPKAAPLTPADTTTTVARPAGGLLINLSIDSVYSRGKDKAAACSDDSRAHCVAVDNAVFVDAGEVRSGCHLSWQLYPDSSPSLLEKGSIQYCHTDTIYLGKSPGPMPAGTYRLEVSVELDDGTTGSTTYRFSLIE